MKNIANNKRVFTIDSIPEPENIGNVIFSLMVNPNLSCINYFNDFSEKPVSPDTIGEDESDEIGLFDIDETGKSMALSTHAFHHYLQKDPQKATEILIARATRKMYCMGAKPIAVSAFLYHIDFADPKGQDIASGAKKGLENAARMFSLNISDRKIRFDHSSGYGTLPATIIISMVGSVENKNKIVTHPFKKKGSNIFMIGKSVNDIASSEYLEFFHEIDDSPLPAFNIQQELKIHKALKGLHKYNLLRSASPIGKGGLFFTLLRAAIPNEVGFDITTDAEIRLDSFLLGESMGRILVEVDPKKHDQFVDYLYAEKVPFITLGHITKGEIRIDEKSLGYIDKMAPEFNL